MNISKNNLRWFWLSIVIILLDQFTKGAAREYLVFASPKVILPNLSLTLLFNQGAAFSFLSSAGGWQKYFFGLFAVVISVILIVYVYRLPKSQALRSAGCALIVGGALSNVIDRIIFGGVTDFIDFHIGAWHWQAFNIADSAVCVGVVLLLLASRWSQIATTSKI